MVEPGLEFCDGNLDVGVLMGSVLLTAGGKDELGRDKDGVDLHVGDSLSAAVVGERVSWGGMSKGVTW